GPDARGSDLMAGIRNPAHCTLPEVPKRGHHVGAVPLLSKHRLPARQSAREGSTPAQPYLSRSTARCLAARRDRLLAAFRLHQGPRFLADGLAPITVKISVPQSFAKTLYV